MVWSYAKVSVLCTAVLCKAPPPPSTVLAHVPSTLMMFSRKFWGVFECPVCTWFCAAPVTPPWNDIIISKLLLLHASLYLVHLQGSGTCHLVSSTSKERAVPGYLHWLFNWEQKYMHTSEKAVLRFSLALWVGSELSCCLSLSVENLKRIRTKYCQSSQSVFPNSGIVLQPDILTSTLQACYWQARIARKSFFTFSACLSCTCIVLLLWSY